MEPRAKLRLRSKGSELAAAARREGAAAGDLRATAAAAAASIAQQARTNSLGFGGLGRRDWGSARRWLET